MLPSIVDIERDDYTVTATLENNNDSLPSWITFDSRRFVISPPKGTSSGSNWYKLIAIENNYNIKIRITDSGGMLSEYTLYVQINSSPLILKSIQNVTLTSPQTYNLYYKDILLDEENYDLNSSISLKNLNGSLLPYWIEESKIEYNWKINTLFNPSEATNYELYFQVTDYWGDIVKTDPFRVTVLPNTPPSIINRPSNVTFYKGQSIGVVQTSGKMFVDSGDTFKIYTTLWVENDSKSVRASYIQANSSILVTYPIGFVGIWTIGVVAKDSVDNISLFLFRITIAEWGQSTCNKCTSSLIQSWTECEKHHILNLKTGDWVPILNINSLSSVKIIGIFTFFFLIMQILVSCIWACFINFLNCKNVNNIWKFFNIDIIFLQHKKLQPLQWFNFITCSFNLYAKYSLNQKLTTT